MGEGRDVIGGEARSGARTSGEYFPGQDGLGVAELSSRKEEGYKLNYSSSVLSALNFSIATASASTRSLAGTMPGV